MIRDSLYKKIIEGLEGKLDGNQFEACVADILREIYPGLVPITGGVDHGMDGAVPDTGPTYPLVCTTDQRPATNLGKSLDSYVEHGGRARKAIFATSRKISPQLRRKLGKIAEERGFELVQVYDQVAMANLLYGKPKWRIDLLGIPGDPPALSVIPSGARLLIEQPLIGRDADLDWLKAQIGDAALIGQPGLGKTALLHAFAVDNGGLFVNRPDITAIADDIREQKPNFLIVDDAHLKTNLITALRHLRKDSGFKFRIVASSWPAEKDEVLKTLELPATAARDLELIRRDDMVKIIVASGITQPPWLVSELLNQAEGRPGLAVTLCHIMLRGELAEIRQGDALARDIKSTYTKLVGEAAIPALAAYAIGGDAGMDTDAVAKALGLKPLEVHLIVSRLAAGGVLDQLEARRFSVRPPVLRYALVRDVFYSKSTTLDIKPLVESANSLHDVAETILHTRLRGATVADADLHSLLERVDDSELWGLYCYLGPEYAEWVLENRPLFLESVARHALTNAPAATILKLLTKAVGDTRRLHSTPSHPLRQLDDWICSAYPGRGEVVPRRKSLIEATIKWMAAGGDSDTGASALMLGLSPKYSDNHSKPGSGREFVFSNGVVTPTEMTEIEALWPQVEEALKKAPIKDWSAVIHAIEDWASPGRVYGQATQVAAAQMKAFAARAIPVIIDLMKDRPGFARQLNRAAKAAGVSVASGAASEFDIVYPEFDYKPATFQKTVEEQHRAALVLADSWSTLSAGEVARKIASLEKEARAANMSSNNLRVMCERIASTVEQPEEWLKELTAASTSGSSRAPFIKACISKGVGIGLVEEVLAAPATRGDAATTILVTPESPAALIDKALEQLEGLGEWLSILILREEFPQDRIARLLGHKDPAIAGTVAMSLWAGLPKKPIPDALRETWKGAIVRCPSSVHGIEEILREENDVAVAWLERAFREGECGWRDEDAVSAAANGLATAERIRLLEVVPGDYNGATALGPLIGSDLAAFQALLKSERLQPLHLEPLRSQLTPHWIEQAQAAMAAGYAPKDVARAVLTQSRQWWGSEAAMWAGLKKAYTELLDHANPSLKEVARIVVAEISKYEEVAAKREKKAELYGI